MSPSTPPVNEGSAADLDLRRALQALPPAEAAAELSALQDRVLADWQRQHGRAPQATWHRTLLGGAGGSLSLGGDPAWRRRMRLGLAGLLLLAAVGAAWFYTHPEPGFDELMEPDVLSQMAAGEL